MHNPFFFGSTVEGNAFINREAEIQSISDDLHRGQNIILFSPRRYGKTSLIKQVMHTLENRNVLCIYIDLYTVTSLDEFYKEYSSAIARSFSGPAEAIISFLHAVLPILKPRVVYAEPGAPSVEVEAQLATLQKPATLRELFESVERHCAKRGYAGAVIFDEFQEISLLSNGTVLEREMRSVFQHHRNVSYAFLGSKMHLMNELFHDKNRPFYNFGKRMELEAIDASIWHRDITGKFYAGGYHIEPAAVATIVETTCGHPYYTQLLCSEIWDEGIETKKVTAEDVRKIVSKALEKENHAFEELWDSLSRLQRKCVRVLAREPGIEMFSADVAARYRLGASSSIERVLGQLRKKGIVAKKERRYELTDPFLTLWIRAQ